MKPKKKIMQVLGGERLDPPPVWLMRQAGRYLPEYRALRQKAGGFLEMAYEPDYAEEVTLQPIRRFGLDGAILFSDILTVPDALGQKLSFAAGEGPQLPPIRNSEDVRQLAEVDAAFHAHLAPVYETVARLSHSLPKDVTLLGFAGAPWTVACYMVEGKASKDYAAIKQFAFADPQGFGLLLERLVEAISAYLIRQIDAGAEVVQIFDSHAGQLAEEDFSRFVIAPTRAIVAQIKQAHPAVPIIGFPRGAGVHLPRYAREVGVDALGLDTATPLSWAHDVLPPEMPVQGNLDPIRLLAGGESLKQAVAPLLAALKTRPHIFNLGHGIHKHTPPEHVEQLLQLVRSEG